MESKSCNCGGNSSLRSVIGGVVCENCHCRLTEAQAIHRIISQLNELSESVFEHIGALQKLGADKCDQCREWALDTWSLYDHCACPRCLESCFDVPLSDEDLEEKEWDEMALSIVRFLSSRGLKLHLNTSLYREEMKAIYAKITA